METEKSNNLFHEPLQVTNVGLAEFAEDLKWISDADPVLMDGVPAPEAISAFTERMILHIGPYQQRKD